MKKWLAGIIMIPLFLSTISAEAAKHDSQKKSAKFRLGVEVLLQDRMDLIKNKRVGLITNPTGVDQNLHNIADLLYHHPNVKLTALYGPEHGVRGSVQAGAYIEKYTDEKTGLPVYSLYGRTKKPTAKMLKDIDVLLFDIQDVGSRSYTYIYTMALAMEAAKENRIPIIVLDRPNPIAGMKVEGPVLEHKYSSFVGKYPIPIRHGMTVGELAIMFNEVYGIAANLTVVKMKGWERNMYYDDTPLQYIMPSPNMPTLDTALAYPGTGLIEGTNVSEGRGTTRPFEFIGAPYIDGGALAAKLNSHHLPGVIFRTASFIPVFSKFAGQLTHGIQIHVTNRDAYKPVETGIYIIKIIHDMYPGRFRFTTPDSGGGTYFDQLAGNGTIRAGIEAGRSMEELEASWQKELNQFRDIRKQYLLY